jgi:hypothetical protein
MMTRRQISETLGMEGLQLIHIAVPLGHNQADCHHQDPLMVVPPFSIFDHMLTYYCYIFYHATHLLSTLHLVLKKPLRIICFAQAGRIFSVKKYPTSMNSAD